MGTTKKPDELDERAVRIAQKELAKTGLLQVRMEPPFLEQLYALASARKMRASVLVRDLILAEIEKANAGIENPTEFDVMNLTACMNDMMGQMVRMREEINALKQQLPVRGPTPNPPPSPAMPSGLFNCAAAVPPPCPAPQAVAEGYAESVAPSVQQSAAGSVSGMGWAQAQERGGMPEEEMTPKISADKLKKRK